jgi:hypothetical protein
MGNSLANLAPLGNGDWLHGFVVVEAVLLCYMLWEASPGRLPPLDIEIGVGDASHLERLMFSTQHRTPA